MEEILKIDTVDQYNKLFGFETRHPQVGVVSFDTAESQGNYRMTMGFYSVFLKETAGCRINYGITQFTVLLISSVTIVSMPIARRYQTLRLSSVRSSRIERRSEWMITNISTMMAR